MNEQYPAAVGRIKHGWRVEIARRTKRQRRDPDVFCVEGRERLYAFCDEHGVRAVEPEAAVRGY